MNNSTKARKNHKPAKPRKDFPLFPHATGRWAKKVKGKFEYFGKVADDPDGQAALEKWLAQKDDLLAGRRPRTSNGSLTVRDLCNRFLTAKLAALESGELSPRTFKNYSPFCQRLIDAFGKNRPVTDLAADDFEELRARITRDRGLNARKVEIQQIRCIFRYAYEAGLIDQPVRFGPSFKAPSKKHLQLERHEKGAMMFEPQEIRAMLDAAIPTMKTMILLGVNCGFGNMDISSLPLKAVELINGWIDFPRPKTGMIRRCPLWPETVEALRGAIANRPTPKDKADAELVFITRKGNRFVRLQEKKLTEESASKAEQEGSEEKRSKWANMATIDSVGYNMQKLLKKIKLKSPGKNFYVLRHVFETIAGDSRDQVAVDAIMGHSRGDMASVYRERISDERLKAVTDHVHKWLFGTEENK
jgi:integrase